MRKSYAAFGQATWTPAGFDIFHLTAGARYTKDKRDGVLDVVNGNANVGGVATSGSVHLHDKGRFDPLVDRWRSTPRTDIHLYAKYSTGYRAGGANDRSATFAAFGPETVKAYEIGAKMDFCDHRARLNLAGYHHEPHGHADRLRQRRHQSRRARPSTCTPKKPGNAPGTSKIKGIEADLTFGPSST